MMLMEALWMKALSYAFQIRIRLLVKMLSSYRHGGPVIQNALLGRLFELGAIAAKAGEFSMRAFENGKMDLVQAEAIADLIDATSQAAARSAVRSLQGAFSTKLIQF